jgi:hypothetical protein
MCHLPAAGRNGIGFSWRDDLTVTCFLDAYDPGAVSAV